MKVKKNPINIKNSNNLEYHCLRGLKGKSLKWANEQIKKFEFLCVAVPYGIIRQEALKILNEVKS